MKIEIGTQDKPFFSSDILKKFKQIKDIGFDGFEIDGKLLCEHFDEVKSASKATGLKVISACGGYSGWIGDFDVTKRAKGIADISDILDKLGQLGAKGIVVPAAWGMFSLRLPPMTPPRSSADDEAILIDSLSQLEKIAIKSNTYIYLEPLNRYEDHMLNTLESAHNIINKGNFKRVKIMADFFHMNIEEANISQSLEQYSSYIDHLHVASSHRYQPGSGHIDYANELKILKKLDFNGAIVFECRVLGDNPLESYEKSLNYMQQCVKSLEDN